MSKIDGMYRRAYVGGTFDCLHRGHLALLKAVRSIAMETVVSLNTDDFAAFYKRRPLMDLLDRIAVLEQCRLVDIIAINTGGSDSKEAIVASNVDCIVHGDDWTGESLMKQMGLTQEWLDEAGIEMVTVPYTPVVSTSQILELYDQRQGYTDQPETVMCAGCNRAIYTKDANSDGKCGECATMVGHD